MDDPKLILDLDLNELTKEIDSISKEVGKALQEGAENLALMTDAKVKELASEQLHTRAKEYKDNVTFEEVEEGVWVVTLKQPAMWIEEGVDPGSMVDNLLKNNPKINKEGKRYKAIPFEHSKNPSQQTPQAQELVKQIKQHMRRKKIPFRKLELGRDGSPRVGLLHRFSIDSDKPTSRAKTDALKNVTVYQTKDKVTGTVRRDVLTFRTVTEDHKEEGLWVHPGLPGVKLFDKAFDWALTTWEREIMPDILSSERE